MLKTGKKIIFTNRIKGKRKKIQLRQNYNLDAKIGCIIHLQFEIKQILKKFYFEFMYAFSFFYT